MYYFAHGIVVESTIHFPELNEVNLESNVTIKYGIVDSLSEEKYKEYVFLPSKIRFTLSSVYILWNDIEFCKIIGNNEIVVNRETGLPINFLRTLLLGQALGILLQKRGRLVLHANAIKMNDGVVAFLGSSGVGKSTTSLIFNKRGYPLVSDDILSVEFAESGFPTVFPGFPRVKMWPDAIKFLNDNLGAYEKVHPDGDKCSCLIRGDFLSDTQPFKCIYVLKRSNKNKIIELKTQNSLIELLKNSYCFNIFHNTEKLINFNQCSDLVRNIPIKCLNIENSLEKLDDIVELVEKDIYKHFKDY